jgi:hypothetical protein
MQDADPEFQHEAVLALTRVDPDGEILDRLLPGPATREELLGLLRDVGVEGRSLRHALQARWRKVEAGALNPVPPGLEAIWPALTLKERELLSRMWQNRRPEGLAVTDLYPLLKWEQSLDPDNNLRTHLSKIAKKCRSANIEIPWKRRAGRIEWTR